MNSSEYSLLNLLFYNSRSSFRFGFQFYSATCFLFSLRLVFDYLPHKFEEFYESLTKQTLVYWCVPTYMSFLQKSIL